MKKAAFVCMAACGLLTLGLLAASGEAAPIYVTTDGVGDGSDWSMPTSLTNALAIAGNGSEIWLAQGTYTNSATFTVRTNCTLYGGFTNGMLWADRNWTTYPTMLDGRAQNRRVVTVIGTNVTLDGLSISNSSGTVAGGITKTVAGNLTLANCRLVNHVGTAANQNGLGGYFTAGSVLMTNCVVATNTSTIYSESGLGVYSSGANLQLVDCLFSNQCGPGDDFNNRVLSGLALYFDNGLLSVLRTDFIGNSGGANCGGGGGAVYLGSSTNTSVTFSNCVFRGNLAKYSAYSTASPGYGGAMWANLAAGKTATVANCTFKDNLNDQGNGGAIYVSGGTLILKNSIVWTNAVRSGYTGRDIYRAGGSVLISYTCLGGLASPSLYGVAATNMFCVMTNNPLYASTTDVHLQSPTGRWTNGTFVTMDKVYSPCIDAGDPSSLYNLELEPNGYRVNLGAYGNTTQASKSPGAAPLVANRGVSLDYTRATFRGELTNATAVIAEVGVCYGTNSVTDDITNGWQYVTQIYPSQQTGAVFSAVTPYPYLLTNTTYYYRWYATNAYGGSWAAMTNFTTGSDYPPGWGVGGGSNVIHVKRDAVGGGNGVDWFNAYTTIMGGYLAVSGARSNIWIAGGVYAEGFQIPVGTNLTMIGGFTGTETNAAGRTLTNALGVATNYTSLNGESAYRCLGISSGNVWLDTLVFSNCPLGQAVNKAGSGALTMNNCRIVGNSGAGNGAGGYFSAGSVFMTNCVVASNTVTTYSLYGFGLYSSGANVQLVDCLFSNNYGQAYTVRSGAGVGLAFDNGTLVVTRTDFVSNGRPGHGGGGGAVYLGNSTNMAAFFSNCVFRDNQSGNTNEYTGGSQGYGGAIWANLNGLTKTVTVANCTFKDSLNDKGNGGAIYVSAGTLVLKNSILWTNAVRSGYSGREIYANSTNSFVTNSYTCFSGTNPPQVVAAGGAVIGWGDGVIVSDPLYASATDVHLKSKGGRYDPASGTFVTTDTVTSPCIDAGDPASAYASEPRPNGNRVNMGAYGNTAQASKTYRPGGTVFAIR